MPIRAQLRIWSTLFVREAVRALSRNKPRAALTALGITIGIAAVVCVSAIGRAGSEHAEEQLRNLGNNYVWIEAGSRNAAGVRTGTHGMNTLTPEDAEAILREVPLIKSVSPHADSNVGVASEKSNWTTRYRGVGVDYIDIRRWKVAQGAAFTDEDVKHATSVVLLGQTVREQLFGDENPVGRTVRIQAQLFQVIGVLARKGQTATGQDQDDTILLPYTTALRKLRGKGFNWVDDIMCSAVSPQAVNPAIDQIQELLRQRHHIQPGQDDDFNIRRPDEIIKAQIEASRNLELFLISVASIALLVGGIGIMNIMLVAVTERTREIGVRLAVGAKQWAVQSQFLGEAILLSLTGGVAGLVVGIGSSFAIGRFLQWRMSIPLQAIVVAPLFSIGVGVFFGFYPAWHASRLDPIAALHHE